jgi:hypothetical protein
MTSLPQHFTVGASVNAAAGDGTLTVAPGAIVLRLDPTTRRQVGLARLIHEGDQLTMLIARLLPPFANTRLVIAQQNLVAFATLPAWSRPRLRDSIEKAGFRLAERSDWLFRARPA